LPTVPETVREMLAHIERLLGGRTSRHDEAAILAILHAATGSELSTLLCAIDLRRLVGDVDDRRLGPKNRTALLSLFGEDRLDELDVPARAALISALQAGRTDDLDERSIVKIVLGTRGAELTELKNALDAGADHRDLQQLVYSDIDDDDRRARVLAHIASEGAPEGTRSVKLLSDIDDTFYCNWVDQRYPKKTVYPGVRQLYLEIDRGPDQHSDRLGDVAFVTARPKDRPGVIERLTHRTLRAGGAHDPTILSGSFKNLIGNASIADKKLQNFVEYAALFPEYDFVFVGDSGQGDAMFGQRMRETRPERVRAVLIHDVVATSAAQRDRWAAVGVELFDTYIGAAVLSLERRLVHPDGCRRVVDAAMRDLEAIEFDDGQRADARRREHERDRARAEAALSA
jgi:hypothetical protein